MLIFNLYFNSLFYNKYVNVALTFQACFLYTWLDIYAFDISEKLSFCISGTEFFESWTEFCKNWTEFFKYRTEFSNNFVDFFLIDEIQLSSF